MVLLVVAAAVAAPAALGGLVEADEAPLMAPSIWGWGELEEVAGMPTRKIDELVWMAFTDSEFRGRLFQGARGEVLAGLGLTEAEQEAVLSARVDTVEALAGALCGPSLGTSGCG